MLGATSALAGTALGVALTPLLIRGLNRWADYGVDAPLDIRWVLLGGIALCAVVSTLIAALLPARRLGRLDIVGVMRGQAVSPPPSKVVLAVGAVLSALGALVILGSTGVAGLLERDLTSASRPEATTPSPLAPSFSSSGHSSSYRSRWQGSVGSARTSLTTLADMARDLARYRSRSAPSVAAVLGGGRRTELWAYWARERHRGKSAHVHPGHPSRRSGGASMGRTDHRRRHSRRGTGPGSSPRTSQPALWTR